MLVHDCMTRNVVTASPSTSVLVARRLLTQHGIRHLPVVEGDEVVGIVSDRDIRINDGQLMASLGSLQSDLVSGRYRRLASVMTTPVHVVPPTMKVHIAALFMVNRGIDALPVAENGKLVGIITLTDCVRALAIEDHSEHTDAPAGLEAERRVTMPAGDPRPGRPQARPAAVVVDRDPAARLRARDDLAKAGYDTVTCPGPTRGAYCPAVRETSTALRCPRVPAATELVLLQSGEDASNLADAYSRWLPNATIRLTSA